MPVTVDLANRYYDVLVVSVGSPDLEYLRWSFVYTFCDLRRSRYQIDSRLGEGGIFSIEGEIPMVICDKDLDSRKEAMLQLANHMIREIHKVVPASVVKQVPIIPHAPQRSVPIRVRRRRRTKKTIVTETPQETQPIQPII